MNAIAASRLRSIVYDTDFQTNVLDVAQTAGYSIPPFSTRVILNRLMKDMKNIGFYQLQDTIANFAVGDPFYSSFSIIDWKKTGNIYTPYGGLIYNPEGIKGNGINTFMDTNFNPNSMGVNYTLDDASQGGVVYLSPNDDNQSNIISGVTSGGTLNTMYNLYNTGQRVNSGTNPVDSLVDLSGIGLKCLNRDNSTTMRLYNKDTIFNRNSNSVNVENENQVLLRRGTFYGNVGLSVYFMGASIPGEIVQDFRTVFNQFLSRLNLIPIA